MSPAAAGSRTLDESNETVAGASGRANPTERCVESFLSIEPFALGIAALELGITEASAHLVDADLSKVRFGFFPHLTRLVHECLRHTVKQGRPVPVARVNCETSEPKVRGGNPGTISDSTKDA
jgi:hypothetical protein